MVDLPKKKVGIIACSGEELPEGTVTRLSALKVLEQLRPADTVTICLPLFLAGGEGDRSFARFYPTIAVDGCELRCAARATEMYSGTPAASVVVTGLVAEIGLEKPQGARRLNRAGMKAVDLTADCVAELVDELLEKKWNRRTGECIDVESVIPVQTLENQTTLPEQPVTMAAGARQKVTVSAAWNLGPESYWWPNIPFREDYRPTLHWLTLSVVEHGTPVHERRQRFGFVEQAEGPYYYTVNGVRYTSFSDSNSYGQVGEYDCWTETPCFQPPHGSVLGCLETWRRYQHIGFNSMRLSTSVPTRYMLDTADEAGYLLIPEGGSWGTEPRSSMPSTSRRNCVRRR